MLPHQQDPENALQEFIKSWSMHFYTKGINKLFFAGKNVLIVMVPLSINKDVFEPINNDLKFSLKSQFLFDQAKTSSLEFPILENGNACAHTKTQRI